MKFLRILILLLLFKFTSIAQINQRELKENQYPIISVVQKVLDTASVRFHTVCATSYNSTSFLLIVNGKRESVDSIKNLDENSISSVRVMKGKEAVRAFGRKAKNGVVIVILKKT
jgi:hypothetical protein